MEACPYVFDLRGWVAKWVTPPLSPKLLLSFLVLIVIPFLSRTRGEGHQSDGLRPMPIISYFFQYCILDTESRT
jgi:hypothetical protein